MDRRVALVVQHDRPTAELIGLLLGQRGYVVELCATYAQASSSFVSAKPSLVVIDPVLIDGDGLDLVRSAKASATVIITSAFPTGVASAARNLGVPLVTKPFETDELMALVERSVTT